MGMAEGERWWFWIKLISHFEDEDDDDDSSPWCGELRAGTIGQIQLAMLTPVGSYSAKDKTGEEMIQEFVGTTNEIFGQVNFVQNNFNTFSLDF